MTTAHTAEDMRPHVLRHSSGCGRSYFDAQGIRRQESRYLVRIWCDCGWTGMTDIEGISDLWKQHSNDHPYTQDSLGIGCVCGRPRSAHSDGAER